ncbi:hypothetical protein JMF89_04700 [Clostridiaceae bacterium UIB06]|uniref:Uncharacterized protein n=1 Tax=Clostridium thailandense TaxID=2794346 RepID=A0A949TVH0_9CLOT|nr:hypothetical protein [Clostridium thailandense]MBV7272200.1 hypothetical protein [Clostridium thailandense]MCH5136515.1 hypothetical protein [Clostridiaceae bacterium UIB06]
MTAVGLLLIGILLIAININTIRKEKNSFNNILNSSESNIKDYELEIGKLRKEFAETVLELQNEIQELKAEIELKLTRENQEDNNRNNEEIYKDEEFINNTLNNKVIEYENIINDINYDVIRNENIETEEVNRQQKSGHNSVKVEEISKFLDEGLSVDEIAEKIGVGKGEVLLIKELYIK